MMTPVLAPETFDRALAALEWTLLGSRRDTFRAGSPLVREHPGAGFVYLSRGAARISLPEAPPQDVAAGDLVFFPRAHETALLAFDDAEIVDVGFESARQPQSVADGLPAAIVVRGFDRQEPTMVALVEAMVCPSLTDQISATAPVRPGDSVICSRIATTIVSTALRSWNEAGCAPEGWLRHIDEPYLSVALDALHANPGAAWTVDDLARIAAMSRSAFAARFRDVVRETPLAYVASVRMESAKALLSGDDLSVGQIAASLGYSSSAGFSRAFHRHTGTTPGRWRSPVTLAS